MEHLSEVLKILDAALMHDTDKAASYATLLASKLEDDRELRQARMIRTALAKLPSAYVDTSFANLKLPVDTENSLAIVDLHPAGEIEPPELVLHPYIRDRIDDFLDSVRMHDQWAAHGVASSNRLLIYGPPGTGKTSIAMQIARDLKLPLVLSRSDALMSSLLGQTSRNIRSIFDFVSSSPTVLFLDEFDALAKNRSDSREIGELQRVVIALLQNLDALDPTTVVIAATNHPELLDPAVWRRFDYTLKVDLPNDEERGEIWRTALGDLAPDTQSLARLVEYSDGMSGAAIRLAANDISRLAIKRTGVPLQLPDMLRRLARVLWFDDYNRFENDRTEIAALRKWAPDVFTVRALSGLFGVSARQVNNAIKS